MKISLLLTLFFLSQVNAISFSQVSNISLSDSDIEIRKVLKIIENQTELRFFYSESLDALDKKVNIKAANASIEDVLEILLSDLNLTYKIFDKNLVVISSEEFIKQELLIKGRVTDIDGNPLPGVNVVEKGTTNGSVTDMDGNFTIEVRTPNSVLNFSYVGFLTEEVTIGDRANIDITLIEDILSLDEIVVIGYGSVKKSDLTGSVSSVSAEDLTAYPTINAVQAIQGRTSGVQIQSTNGEPGSDYIIRIRGASSINAGSDPIYVVDGFVGAALPPAEDIASIEILKDASATAIYGSRGANGVIIVSTKRGKQGETRIDLNTSYSLQSEIKRLDLLNSTQFDSYVHEAFPNYVMDDADTDWQDVVLQTGKVQNYQLSVSSGKEKVRYYLSGIYYDQEGIIITSKYNRISLQSNVDVQPIDRLKFGANIFLYRSSRDGVRTQEDSGGGSPGVIASSFRFVPDLGVYKEDGTFTRNKIGEPGDNPYASATQRINENISDRMQTNLYAEYDIFEGLKFRTTLGASASNGRTGTYEPVTLTGGENVQGDASVFTDKSTMLLNENYFTYTKKILDAHEITVLGGYSYQKSRYESMRARGQNFISDAYSYWNLGAATVRQAPASALTETELASYYGRLNYSLLNKYLITLNARYDGSSSFSKNHKWAFFPSGAIAWNIKNESFMQNVDWLSQFKLRTSYGMTGNQAIAPYQTLANLSSDPAVIGGVPQNGVRPTSVANNELTWETTTQTDIGTDVGVLQNRINITADYYIKKTEDLLFSVPLPQYSGYSTQLSNIGSVENKGFEFSLSSRNFIDEFKWNMDFNISFNKNKILALPDGEDIPYQSFPGHMVGTGSTQLLRVGESVGAFYGFIYDGVYQEGDTFLPGGGFEQDPGGEKYRDINGIDVNGELTGEPDGQLNNNDRTIIGNPHPDFIWGWNNDFSWKGFDLNIFIQGTQGNDIYSYTLMELGRMSGGSNATTRALDRWTPTNTKTDVPRVNPGRAYKPSTQWVFDGSYIRLKNISLGYNLPQSMFKGLGIRSFKIYVSAQNILTISDYPGTDPEVNYLSYSGKTRNTNLGLDYGSYPNTKSVTFGLNVGF